MSFYYHTELPLPSDFKETYPLSEKMKEAKCRRDREISDIFTGKSHRFLVIIGPCSADREDAVCEYVCRLAKISEKTKDRLLIIPRIYTSKPRTTGTGYKGMLHQPNPLLSPDLAKGLVAVRNLHLRAFMKAASAQPTNFYIQKSAATWMTCCPMRQWELDQWKTNSIV